MIIKYGTPGPATQVEIKNIPSWMDAATPLPKKASEEAEASVSENNKEESDKEEE